ncbi:MAG: thioredoxin domain-containing protein, partial [Candidatus Micrarchaeota archaeon]
MPVIEISKPEELRTLIDSGKPLLVMFSAEWCGDCKSLLPHFEKAAEKLEKDRVKVVRIILSKEREVVGDKKKALYPSPEHEALRQEFSKYGFPTVVFFKDKRVMASTVIEDMNAKDTAASLRKFTEHFLLGLKTKNEAVSCPTGGCSGNRDAG